MIEYRYLNIDTEQFVSSQSELALQVGPGSLLRAIPADLKFNQVLIVGGKREYTEREAVYICRKLSGLLTTRRNKMALNIIPLIATALSTFKQSKTGQQKIPGFHQNLGELLLSKTNLLSSSPLIAIGVSLLADGDNLGHLYIFIGAGFIFLRDNRYSSKKDATRDNDETPWQG